MPIPGPRAWNSVPNTGSWRYAGVCSGTSGKEEREATLRIHGHVHSAVDRTRPGCGARRCERRLRFDRQPHGRRHHRHGTRHGDKRRFIDPSGQWGWERPVQSGPRAVHQRRPEPAAVLLRQYESQLPVLLWNILRLPGCRDHADGPVGHARVTDGRQFHRRRSCGVRIDLEVAGRIHAQQCSVRFQRAHRHDVHRWLRCEFQCLGRQCLHLRSCSGNDRRRSAQRLRSRRAAGDHGRSEWDHTERLVRSE